MTPPATRAKAAGALLLALLAASLPGATWAGLFFPDIDLALQFFLGHRSILTHSALMPLLALRFWTRDAPPLPVAWFSFGVAVHLFADVFPRSWRGFALVELPFSVVSLGPALSPIWIGANAVVCLWLCEWVLAREHVWLTRWHYLASAAAVGLYAWLHEGKIWLALLFAGLWVAVVRMVGLLAARAQAGRSPRG